MGFAGTRLAAQDQPAAHLQAVLKALRVALAGRLDLCRLVVGWLVVVESVALEALGDQSTLGQFLNAALPCSPQTLFVISFLLCFALRLALRAASGESAAHDLLSLGFVLAVGFAYASDDFLLRFHHASLAQSGRCSVYSWSENPVWFDAGLPSGGGVQSSR